MAATLVDVQSDFARSGERDVAGLRMRDHGIAEARSCAGAEVHYAFGHADFFEQLDEFGGNGRRIARRLQDDGVAADDRGDGHAGHDGAGEIPGRNHGADAERNVGQRVALARQLHRRFGFREAQSFAGVELAEIDGLGDIGVGLAPVLADFKNQPRHVFHFALAHQVGGAEQQAGALFDRSVVPGLEGFERGLHGRLDVLFAGLLMDSDNLRRAARDSAT